MQVLKFVLPLTFASLFALLLATLSITMPQQIDLDTSSNNVTNVTRASILDRNTWLCYLGRLGFPPETIPLANKAYFSNLYLRDFYAREGGTLAIEQQLLYMLQGNNLFLFNNVSSYGDWIADPTHGLQQYSAGCMDDELLVTSDAGTDNSSQFNIGAALGFWSPDHQARSPEWDVRKALFPIETMRVESRQVFPNGIVMVVQTTKIPDGLGAWPAIWMLGTPEKTKWEKNGNAFAASWPNGGQGEIDFFEMLNGTYVAHPFAPASPNYTKFRFQTLHTPKSCRVNTFQPINNPVQTQVECNKGTIDSTQKCNAKVSGYSGVGCENNGCVIQVPVNESIRNIPYTFVFEYSKKARRVRTYSFPTDVAANDVLNDVLKSEAEILDIVHEKLLKFSKNENAQHLWSDSSCEGVFDNMHMIINTAICGDWAAETDKLKKTRDCEKEVVQHATLDVDDQKYWNLNTTATNGYKFKFDSFRYKAL